MTLINERRYWMPRRLAVVALLALVLVACGKKSPEELLKDAYTAAQRGDTIGALLKAQKIVKNYPDSPLANKARILMAGSHMQNNEVESARTQLQAVIDAAGLKTDIGQQAFRNMVATYNMANDVEGAIKMIEEALPSLKELPAFETEARVMLASFYQASKQPEKATAILEDMLAKSETERERLQITELMVGMAMRQDDPGRAVELYKGFLEKYPDSQNKAIVLFGMGFFYNRLAEKAEAEAEKKKHEEAAAKALRESLELVEKQIDAELAPQRRMALVDQKAKILMESGRSEEAVKSLLDFVAENPELDQRVMLLSRAADLRLMENKLDEGKAILERIVTEFPNTTMAQQAGKGIALIERKQQMESKAPAQTDAPVAPAQAAPSPAKP